RARCSREGNRPGPAEGGHPRPSGRRGPELPAPPRLRRRRRTDRTRGRPRSPGERSGRRPRRGGAHVRAAAREPADRELRDRDRRTVTARRAVTEPRPTVAIVVFPGSNDDRDAAWALSALDARPALVWHGEDRLPPDTGAVVLPGGFSYGDYLRCGAIARFSPLMKAVTAFASDGGRVLGICNGFQILCEAGLLPGVLLPNASLSFVCRDVVVRVEQAASPFTDRCETSQRLVIPVKHGDGCWYGPAELVEELDRDGRVVLRYEPGENPNGSAADVAGVLGEDGNVMGLMPHPEHAVDPMLGSGDGALILASLVDAARERLSAAAVV